MKDQKDLLEMKVREIATTSFYKPSLNSQLNDACPVEDPHR